MMAILAKFLYLLELMEAIREGVWLYFCPTGILTTVGILGYVMIQVLDCSVVSSVTLFGCILLIVIDEDFRSSQR
jgi:uncharacterized membrane protein